MARATGTARTSAAKKTTAKRTAARRSTSRQPAKRAAAPRRRTATSSAGDAQAQARQAGEQAQQRVRATTLDQLAERSNQAGDQLGTIAGDVRQIAEQLRDQDNDSAARIVDMAADRVEQVGSYLSQSSADKLLNDIEDFSRSRPWLVTAITAAAGFTAARGLSASSRRRHGGSWVDTDAGAGFDEADAEREYDGRAGR
jgi:ABC-type transporter Mla subunit MlaD